MLKRLLLACATALLLLPAWGFHALPEKFEPARDAAADVQQALGLAQAQRKLVLVDVGGEWCAWCHIFDRSSRPGRRCRRRCSSTTCC
jgi:hypothetical protein